MERQFETVWIIEDDRALGTLLLEEVQDAGLDGRWIPSAEEALDKIERQMPDLIVCDLRLPGMDGMSFLRKVLGLFAGFNPGFIIITAFGTIPTAVKALKAGADDFLTKPLDLDHFIISVKRVLEQKRLRETIRQMQGFSASESFHGMLGKSAIMRRLFEQIKLVANAHGPILILGESGSGKELVARAVHDESPRTKNPFLPVNCAGIPEHLMESEFFGHTEGSFTDAKSGRKGFFEEAKGGTLLLDEISEMPVALQAKLLRILQGGKLRRIGENRELEIDVRVIAATNRDIAKEVHSGQFREDLFFRLETFTIHVPPLRERGDDIEFLSARFLRQFALAMNKQIKGFNDRALEMLTRYHFPGNVRELSNAIEHAVAFADGERIMPGDLPTRIRENGFQALNSCIDYQVDVSAEDLPPLADIERRYIRHVLEKVGGNKRKASDILGIGRRTLYRKIGD
ncbi:MAG: sigma-54 dependent transcriptional regulator [Desulfobacterales bacterium]